jgi:dCMP deaminase
MNKWDLRYIEMAYMVAGWSKDPSTKCGAVITDGKRLVSVGFNGFPQNTNDDPKLYEDREEKYRRVQHSERNAILFAQRSLKDCTMYVVPMPPCSQCAGMIIQSGITRVVTIEATGSNKKRWGKDIQSTLTMFGEAGVVVEYIE